MTRTRFLRLLAAALTMLAGVALAKQGPTTSSLSAIPAPSIDMPADVQAPAADIDPATLYDSQLEQSIIASGVGRLAVQNQGVITSLKTCSEILVHEVTGRSRFRKQDPLFTVLSMSYRNRDWMRVAMLPIESPRLASLLGLDPGKKHRVSGAWVMSDSRAREYVLVGMTGDQTDPIASLDRHTQAALASLRARFEALVAMPSQLRIIPVGGGSDYWVSPRELDHPDGAVAPELARRIAEVDKGSPGVVAALALHATLESAFAGGSPEPLHAAVQSMQSAWSGNPDHAPAHKIRLDYFNAAFRPFQKTSYIYFFALVAFLAYLYTARRRLASNDLEAAAPVTELLGNAVIRSEPGYGDPALAAGMEQRPGSRRVWILSFVLLTASAAVLVVALGIRYILSGHMPLSNMYESITFSMGAFALVGLVFEALYRTGWIGAATSLLGMVLMTVANSLPLHMRKVEPLVAVLNSVWLTWHVATLLVSYAAFMLSFVFCIAWFWKDTTGNRAGLLPRKEFFDLLCYRAVQVGWPLLTIGILLGAVWADTAWGNPWSWDPKETWALITWLMYTIYLHLRMNRGWQGRSTIIAAMLGFLTVLITYFGVTYLPGIAGGLHSYAK